MKDKKERKSPEELRKITHQIVEILHESDMLASQILEVLWALLKIHYESWVHFGGTPKNVVGDLKEEYNDTLAKILDEFQARGPSKEGLDK